jgi:hypothetical protein
MTLITPIGVMNVIAPAGVQWENEWQIKPIMTYIRHSG